MPKKSWGYPFVDGIHVHFQFLFVYFGCGTGYLFPCPDVTTVPYHLVQLQRSLVLILAYAANINSGQVNGYFRYIRLITGFSGQ